MEPSDGAEVINVSDAITTGCFYHQRGGERQSGRAIEGKGGGGEIEVGDVFGTSDANLDVIQLPRLSFSKRVRLLLFLSEIPILQRQYRQ